ncbi:melanoma-derived growth regulatory protein [Entelurus aequoreus]|uniref:melanoma-derived growth regulatory protein n=1 Tax=Entelurus aequoreus TaxID=161455 RepID=UPI002B1D50BC|nr:melanoma-derived growth regulatory protein [Entelurus aequoreus]
MTLCRFFLVILLGLLLTPTSDAGRQMTKLSTKKLCADSDCSYAILIARATQDYNPEDCRFISIRQGQLVYVYAMLQDTGNLFWAGSVQDGEQGARLGHFPSTVVEEVHPLMPANTEVKTTKWDFYCN